MQNQSINPSASQPFDQRINHSVRNFRVPAEVGKEAALNSLLLKIKEPRQQLSPSIPWPLWIRTASGIAAVMVAGLFLWVVLSVETIHNEGKQVATFRLPDQSRVVLSPQATISYRKIIWNRHLKLAGKAYFEVEKGGRFSVKAQAGTVEVLGTRFAVEGNDKAMQVICFEGKVLVSTPGSKELLLPGTGVKCITGAKNKLMTQQDTYPDFAAFNVSYHNGKLEVILSDIGKFFDVKIDNQISEERFFTGAIHTGNLETALSIVTGSLELKYKITGKNNIRILQTNKK